MQRQIARTLSQQYPYMRVEDERRTKRGERSSRRPARRNIRAGARADSRLGTSALNANENNKKAHYINDMSCTSNAI